MNSSKALYGAHDSLSRACPEVLFCHNQLPPESHELFRCFNEARKIEELGLTVGAMVMVNRHFLESEP